MASSKEEARKWYNAIKSNCKVVCLHLSNIYTLGKTVESNRYTKTQFGTNKDAGAEHLIKSIIKKPLFDNRLSLVILLLI